MDEQTAHAHLRASLSTLQPTLGATLVAPVRAATTPGADGQPPALTPSRLNGLADTLLGTSARGDAAARHQAFTQELARLKERLDDGAALRLLTELETQLAHGGTWETLLHHAAHLPQQPWAALLPTTRLLLAQTALQLVLVLADAEPLLGDLDKKGVTLQW